MVVCNHVARAALPEDLIVSLRAAVEGDPSSDFLFESFSSLYDQEPHVGKKRTIENFICSGLRDFNIYSINNYSKLS
jgi:hypothetical protein